MILSREDDLNFSLVRIGLRSLHLIMEPHTDYPNTLADLCTNLLLPTLHTNNIKGISKIFMCQVFQKVWRSHNTITH